MISPKTSARFWAKVHKTEQCWIWIAALFRETEYGAFSFNSRPISAHRFSWILHFEEIPKGLFVLHKCDCRRCVRPDHLFVGTQRDNMIDMRCKGRTFHPCGEDSGKARLTNEEVFEIRRLHSIEGMKAPQIARMFDTGERNVHHIINRQSWTHI